MHICAHISIMQSMNEDVLKAGTIKSCVCVFTYAIAQTTVQCWQAAYRVLYFHIAKS